MKHLGTDNKTRIIRRRELQRRLSMSASTIYWRLANDPEFPKQIKLGAGSSVGWLEHEIDAWIETQIAASRNGDAK
jgi:prophage regulatory protein